MPSRRHSMTASSVFRAQCKDCGDEFFFTEAARFADVARGLSPPERCRVCRESKARRVRSVGAAYWDAPLNADPQTRCWAKYGLGRLRRQRDPVTKVDYVGVPLDLPSRSLRTAKTAEEREIIERFGRIHKAAEDLTRALEDPEGPRVCVLVGPTGTGKSTWVPYRLLRSKVGERGRICVTQPRTITLRQEDKDLEDDTTTPGFIAKRLLRAPDRGAGQEIGLLYRGEATQWDRYTRLLFVTDGIALNWLTSGEIANFDVLMIDEAHEQSENMEQIFALLRYKLPLYPRLRVVIASATIAEKKFQEFFGNGNPRSVPVFAPPASDQRTNKPIHDRWPDDTEDGPGYAALLAASGFEVPAYARDCPEAAALIIHAIHTRPEFPKLKLPMGDVLVFMPTVRLVKETVKAVEALGLPKLRVLPCHAQWTKGKNGQAQQFYASERGVKEHLANKRLVPYQRVIVATTFAETSVTISNLAYVIDSGYATSPQWDAATCSTGVDPTERHTRAGCMQRRGRVGRQQPGECFYLYSKADFEDDDLFEEHPRPAVSRSALDRFLLTAKACGVDDLGTFEWMNKEATPPEEVARATQVLHDQQVLDEDGDITPTGVELYKIKTDSVPLSTFIADSDAHGCALEVLVFVSFTDLQRSPFGDDERGLLAFARWRSGCADDLEFYLRIYFSYQKVPPHSREAWCEQNGVLPEVMEAVAANVESNLPHFEAKTHDTLLDRAVNVKNPGRCRVVLARCMPDAAYIRSKNSDYIQYETYYESNLPPVQIDQDSACAGSEYIDAFICIKRRRGMRGEMIAQHIVRVEEDWLEKAPSLGPLGMARLIRDVQAREFGDWVERVSEILEEPPPLPTRSLKKGREPRELTLVREGSPGEKTRTVLAIDNETGVPVLLSAARGVGGRRPAGTQLRGCVVQGGGGEGVPVLSQEGLATDYLRDAGAVVIATVVEARTVAEQGELRTVILELESGVQAVLSPEYADADTWASLTPESVGEPVEVVVLSRSPQQTAGGATRLRVCTAAYESGRANNKFERGAVQGTIHSSIFEKETAKRKGFRAEVRPGCLVSVSFDGMSATLRRRKWRIGTPVELVVLDTNRGIACPRQVVDSVLERYKKGARGDGTIVEVREEAAFVSLSDEVYGYIPCGEVAREYVEDVRQYLKVGERVSFVVLDVTPDLCKLRLSIKQTLTPPTSERRPVEPNVKKAQPDPWSNFVPGATVIGTVTGIQDYGAFVELADGVVGLVHVSEMAEHYVRHPSDEVQLGHRVLVKILDIEASGPRRRMSLSIKQTIVPPAAPPPALRPAVRTTPPSTPRAPTTAPVAAPPTPVAVVRPETVSTQSASPRQRQPVQPPAPEPTSLFAKFKNLFRTK